MAGVGVGAQQHAQLARADGRIVEEGHRVRPRDQDPRAAGQQGAQQLTEHPDPAGHVLFGVGPFEHLSPDEMNPGRSVVTDHWSPPTIRKRF